MDSQDAPAEPAPDNAEHAAREREEQASLAWRERAHAAQLPPEGAWSTWLFLGGRGAGKTRAGAEWIADLAARNPGSRFALIAPTEHDLREVMIEGVSGLLSLPGREMPK